MSEPQCRICGTGLKTGIPYMPEPLLPGDIPNTDELCPKCLPWVKRAVIGFIDSLREAIMEAAADIPPITIRLWLPAPAENRRLPMPLEYA